MKKILIAIVAVSLILLSCRVKEPCEINHTGTLTIENKLDKEVEVILNGTKMQMTAGEKKNFIENPGSYSIKAMYYPTEIDTVISISECETCDFVIE